MLGWRSTVVDAKGAALVDYITNRGKVTGVVHGPSVKRLENAGRKAEQDAPVDQNYEPRILTFGTLGMSELWLHSETAPDRFYSLSDDVPEASTAEVMLHRASSLANQQPVWCLSLPVDDERGG
jgi:hypothetical protein